jgi:hypothetical protein
MSKKTNNNNRFISNNKPTESSQAPKFRKCVHHIHSDYYAANRRQHDDIIKKNSDKINLVDMDNTIDIKIVFHFLAPNGTYNRDRVLSRAHDIILALNDDFNNYTANPNTMNNFKYKSIINQVFISNMRKQNIYLGKDYLKLLPIKPSNITFELGEIYYYPIKNRLNLSQYDDFKEVEMEMQAIKQYIQRNKAFAINPESFINIWIIDMGDTSILSFSNFPWEVIDNYHGIVVNRRVFFPEDYAETAFSMYKTFTHAMGHFLGLLHVHNNDSGAGAYGAINLNADSEHPFFDDSDNTKLTMIYDPTDKNFNKKLHTDPDYNLLFMNFMDYTNDKYVTMFTQNQLQKMRYMLLTYRPKINFIINKARLPVPKYNPETDTTAGFVSNNNNRIAPSIPSRENIYNPRMSAHAQQPTLQGYVNQSEQQQMPQNYAVQPSQQQMPQNYAVQPSQQQMYQGYVVQQPYMPHETIAMSVPNEPRNNMDISKLISNLSVNNLTDNTVVKSKNQIISNIQKHLPKEFTESTNYAREYENSVKKQQDYNSINGYGTYYPYDLYNGQQQNNQMMLYQKMQQEQEKNRQNDNTNTQSQYPAYEPNQSISAVNTDQRLSDPRLINQQMVDPRLINQQMVDPRLINQQMVDPRLINPQMVDPRLINQQMVDPRLINPQMQYPGPYHIPGDPRSIYPQPPVNTNAEKKISINIPEKVDVNLQQKDQKNNEIITDDGTNFAVVKNSRNFRIYPKYANTNNSEPRTNSKEIDSQQNINKNTDIVNDNVVPIMDYQPEHIRTNTQVLQSTQSAQPITPSELMDRVARVDQQIKNIRSALPNSESDSSQINQKLAAIQPKRLDPRTNTNVGTAKNTSQAQSNDKLKYNKFGQFVNTIGTPKIDNYRTPKNRYTRSKAPV